MWVKELMEAFQPVSKETHSPGRRGSESVSNGEPWYRPRRLEKFGAQESVSVSIQTTFTSQNLGAGRIKMLLEGELTTPQMSWQWTITQHWRETSNQVVKGTWGREKALNADSSINDAHVRRLHSLWSHTWHMGKGELQSRWGCSWLLAAWGGEGQEAEQREVSQ